MIEKLKKLVLLDYVANDKVIDSEFCKGIAKIYSEHYGLENLLRGLSFESIGIPNVVAKYDYREQIIRVDPKELNDGVEVAYEQLPDSFSEDEKNAFIYFFIMQTMLHELTHAMQFMDREANFLKFVPEGKRRDIVKLDPFFGENYTYSCYENGEEKCQNKINSWPKYIRKKFGYSLLFERDAEIQAYSIEYSILKGFEEKYPHLKEYMEANVYNATSMGYDVNEAGDVESPAYKYAKALRVNNMIPAKNVPWYDESIEQSTKNACANVSKTAERFKRGLPVTKEEYIKMKAKLAEYNQKGYIIVPYGNVTDEHEEEASRD